MVKINKRNLRLKHYISKDRYLELKYFCLQYNDKKKELDSNYSPNALTDRKGSLPGKPTEQAAIKNIQLEKDLELIEKTLHEACPDIYLYMLKNVTEGIAYEYMDVPISRTRFYDARRYFFYLLAQKK